MIEKMTREDFIKLFGIDEESNSMDCFDETVNTSGMSWYDFAKAQNHTMNFLIRYKSTKEVK